jgi:hypothetical protein
MDGKNKPGCGPRNRIAGHFFNLMPHVLQPGQHCWKPSAKPLLP